MKKFLTALLISVIVGVVLYEVNRYFFEYDAKVAPIIASLTFAIIYFSNKRNN
ncbi:MAG: Uncharacterised protein [Flavobacterium sp. SCGC AAA160-P02]|nr:MAG: Uncharacterised protein [Flavobacterium sp. SCGC AAA160-P02]